VTVTTPTGHVSTVAGGGLESPQHRARLQAKDGPTRSLHIARPARSGWRLSALLSSRARRRETPMRPARPGQRRASLAHHGGARSGSHARTSPRSTVRHVRSRRCSRAGCPHPAASTLTYAYRDSTAVLGPLASQVEPHCYDLCQSHAQSLSAPRGWEVIRLAVEEELRPSTDDLLALADAVRDAGMSYDPPTGPIMDPPGRRHGLVELARRGHLTVLADPGAADAGRRTPT
jgi:Protein of unknown function (DUF3499)